MRCTLTRLPRSPAQGARRGGRLPAHHRLHLGPRLRALHLDPCVEVGRLPAHHGLHLGPRLRAQGELLLDHGVDAAGARGVPHEQALVPLQRFLRQQVGSSQGLPQTKFTWTLKLINPQIQCRGRCRGSS